MQRTQTDAKNQYWNMDHGVDFQFLGVAKNDVHDFVAKMWCPRQKVG